MSPRDSFPEDEARAPGPSTTSSRTTSAMSSAHLDSKLSGETSSRRRAPLQSRDMNTFGGSYRSASSNSTEEFNSKDFRMSTLESSNNEMNKRFMNSTNNSNSRASSHTSGYRGNQSNMVRRSSSNSEIREGSEPNLPTQPRPASYTKRSSSVPNLDDDSVIIEEHRRKINGEGYTVHRYLRGKMLGKGGFAKVYLCTALDTQKAYAIKIVPKSNLVKARALQKVRRKMLQLIIQRSNLSNTNFELYHFLVIDS